jgi:hypothetical protein
MHDEAAKTVEHCAQEKEDAGDVEIGDVHVPVWMGYLVLRQYPLKEV